MSANKIQLQKNDDSVRFIFTDSSHYLTGNGTIDVPVNSLSLVIDKSDMVTFRKAASNDIFVSAPISDFGMSKAEIEEWYAENMVGASGGGGIDPETLAELVSSAEYVSSSSTIDFKNVDGDVISTINAEPFITDGMVDNVQISGNNLVITFNVDAGKQPISIPLSNIFDPSNYYDKSATDALLSGKADVSAVTVDEYSIYATIDNSIYTTNTWLKFYPKSNAATTGNFQFSGITGYLYLQNIDYVNGTYTVGSGSLDPSLVSGLSITFENGAMIIEVDASNPITSASITNTTIEYVKEVIPQKDASDAIYDNVYPLIRKVNNSLNALTVTSASTVQNRLSMRLNKNDGTFSSQNVNLDGYLSYSGTTLKAEAYVNSGTETLTTVSPTINASSRTDYYFIDNVGQTAESNHIEIQILTSDTVTLSFYGNAINGVQRSVSLTVGNGTVTSGYNWPSEATYSLSDGVLTVDYAFTGTAQTTPVSINRILATNQYGSTASVSDIVGYVKALLKDKVEVTEYIENTLKPTIDGKQDTLKYYEEYQNENYSGAQITLSEDGDRVYIDAAKGTYNYIDLFAEKTVNDAELGRDVVYASEMYVDNEEAFLWWSKMTGNDSTYKENGVWLGEDRFKLESKGSGETTALVITPTGVTINDDAVVTVPMLEDTEEVLAQSINVLSDSLSGKQDTLIAGSGITISGNVISANGGGGVDPSILDGKVDKNSIAPLEGISISGECPNEIDGTTGVTKITYSPFTEQYHNIRNSDEGTMYEYDYPNMGKVDFYDENGELLHTIEGIENWDSVPYIDRSGSEVVSGDTIVKSYSSLYLDASPNSNAEKREGMIMLGIYSEGEDANIRILSSTNEVSPTKVEITAKDTTLTVQETGVDINGDAVVTESALSGKVNTSAVTSSITSGSTDVVTSGGVYEQLDGIKLRKVTESQWSTISGSTDASTLYVVTPDPNQA